MDLRKKKIVVTGGAGFLGQHVVSRLKAVGCINIMVPRSAQYDLTSESDIRKLLYDTRPEVVIHLAARVGGIGANRLNPGSFMYANMIMGAQLIEQCRLLGVEKFVMAGTICAYPKFTPVPFKESELWNGYPEEANAPYGIAKKALIVQIQAYKQQYGFNGINLMIVNLYGPGDNFDLESSHVIPALIRKFIEARDRGDKVVTLWGTGTPSREFLYVEDAARAVVTATQTVNDPDPINVGSGREVSIANLASIIGKLTGFKGEIRYDATKPDGQPRRCLDVTRAKDIFGFESTTSLESGLEKTIAWYESQTRQRRAA